MEDAGSISNHNDVCNIQLQLIQLILTCILSHVCIDLMGVSVTQWDCSLGRGASEGYWLCWTTQTAKHHSCLSFFFILLDQTT